MPWGLAGRPCFERSLAAREQRFDGEQLALDGAVKHRGIDANGSWCAGRDNHEVGRRVAEGVGSGAEELQKVSGVHAEERGQRRRSRPHGAGSGCRAPAGSATATMRRRSAASSRYRPSRRSPSTLVRDRLGGQLGHETPEDRKVVDRRDGAGMLRRAAEHLAVAGRAVTTTEYRTAAETLGLPDINKIIRAYDGKWRNAQRAAVDEQAPETVAQAHAPARRVGQAQTPRGLPGRRPALAGL